MTAAVAPTWPQIKALADRVREASSSVRVIGIRSPGRWSGDEIMVDGDSRYRVIQCDAPIEFRMALRDVSEDLAATVLITPLDDTQLGEDIRVRLAGRKLKTVDPWRIVRELFRASRIDPRVAAHRWMADRLLKIAPASGYPPVPGGVLDADRVWSILLRDELGMADGAPDLLALLSWSADAENAARWRAADEPFRAAATDWITRTAGPAGAAVLRCVSVNENPLAPAVGLALGVFLAEGAEGKLDKPAGRLEAWTGTPDLSPALARRWHDAAVAEIRRPAIDDKSRRRWLDLADEVLEKVGAADFAYLSGISPAGFDQRMARFGAALNRALARKPVRVTGEEIAAWESVRSHALAHESAYTRRLHGVDMALRLLKWLARAAGDPGGYPDFAAAAADYVRRGGFVDWARTLLRGSEPVAELSAAYAALGRAVTRVRERQNRAFAELLRDWTAAGSIGPAVLPIERAIETVVAPLARSVPALLILIDGMSHAVFQELLADIADRYPWAELVPADGTAIPPVLATIPSLTRHSRTSFFLGRLASGGGADERKGFAGHPALIGLGKPSAPPRLFAKAEIADAEDNSLSTPVRNAVANLNQRVVGVVINAVDDNLSKGSQTDPRWTVDYIRPLQALLHEARAAGRAVILVSDHGHVLEGGTTGMPDGEGERWRPATSPPAKGEIYIAGSRVLGDDRHELVAPWSETYRYSQEKAGYHGGLTPQEMLVPLGLLSANDQAPDGWKENLREEPDWWRLSADETSEPAASAVPIEDKGGQLALFHTAEAEAETGPPVPEAAPAPDADWLDQLPESPVYQQQKAIAGRVVVSDDEVVGFLRIMVRRGGRLTAGAVARELSKPPFRLRGWLASVQRLLNVEGYPVLSHDTGSKTVTLDVELLKRQLELTEGE